MELALLIGGFKAVAGIFGDIMALEDRLKTASD